MAYVSVVVASIMAASLVRSSDGVASVVVGLIVSYSLVSGSILVSKMGKIVAE